MKQIAFIGNSLPRPCGISTFTTDLCETLTRQYPDIANFLIAVNDQQEGYSYPSTVRFEIEEQNLASYYRAAEFLNLSNVDLVCLQHEYGIFGGPAGSYILELLEALRMPIVTTLHTVLQNPDSNQKKVLRDLSILSDRLIVMNQRGFQLLQSQYNVSREKLALIPHGIPDVPFLESRHYKTSLGLEKKFVLFTFGLLSPNKGIEYVIQALPSIVQAHPEVVYVILGTTHPHVLRQEGETYRIRLEKLAQKSGVGQHVLFVNRFVALSELTQFIGAADIYTTPYSNPEQSVSGTLAYTLGAGKAVISTPYWYAQELLAEERGILVPFADSEAIARNVSELVKDEAKRNLFRKRAYEFGRRMIWKEVAHQYMTCFASAVAVRKRGLRAVEASRSPVRSNGGLPPMKLDHLFRMTDSVGFLQHAVYTVPNYKEGYTTDDNTRALLLMVLLDTLGERSKEIADGISRYLAFLFYAFNPKTNRFRNFLSYSREWLEDVGSEDSQGRVMWVLGTLLGYTKREEVRGAASQLFQQSLPWSLNFSNLRSCAFAILGLHEYLKRFPGHRTAQGIREKLTEKLARSYQAHATEDWPWFEDSLTYCNAVIPHGLLLSAQAMSRQDWKTIGLKALDWLAALQRSSRDHFVPIGCHGFYPRNGTRARFDQQPVEAQAMISASLAAFQITKEERWNQEANRAFQWFLGRNDLGLPLYDSTTGGCRDGLHPDRVNENQGAESTVSFLHSLLELTLATRTLRFPENQLELQLFSG